MTLQLRANRNVFLIIYLDWGRHSDFWLQPALSAVGQQASAVRKIDFDLSSYWEERVSDFKSLGNTLTDE